MMEAGASEVSEAIVLQAIEYAQEINLQGIELQEQLAEEYGKPSMEYVPRGYSEELTEKVVAEVVEPLNEAFGLPDEESSEKSRKSRAASPKNTMRTSSRRKSRRPWTRP